MKKILKYPKKLCYKLFYSAIAILNIPKVVNLPSYYPELPCKSKIKQIFENLIWALQYNETNWFYKSYGFDLINCKNKNDYIDYLSFKKSRDIINKVKSPNFQACLLRDKLLFYKYMKINNLPVPEVFGVIIDKKLFDTNLNQIEYDSLINERDYFIKIIDGECASFVKHIEDYNEFKSVVAGLDSEKYILQKRIVQSKEMDIINPEAINTLRIVTINKNNFTYELSSLLRVGTKETGNVDNWAAGGLAIGINDNGYLKEYGFYKPNHGTKAKIHSDTNVVFSEFMIPQYKEAIELACFAHKHFYGVGAIGWDIAISESGPVFIEGNDNFEISLQQICDRPLRAEWERIISK